MARFNNNVNTEEKIREAINALDLNELETYVSEKVEQPKLEAQIVPQIERKEINFIKNAQFISIVKETEPEFMSEAEFFDLVGVRNNRLSSSARRYQRSLYSHYMRAKREKDEGYKNDVLAKAKILKENIETTKELMKNEAFMLEWESNIGKVSPVEDLKEHGRMMKINIIKSFI